jgi:hypothetical protein
MQSILELKYLGAKEGRTKYGAIPKPLFLHDLKSETAHKSWQLSVLISKHIKTILQFLDF